MIVLYLLNGGPIFAFFLSLQEGSIGFMVNSHFQFSIDVYILETPEHDLKVFGKCLTVSPSVSL